MRAWRKTFRARPQNSQNSPKIPVEIPVEQPSVLRELIQVHRTDLGYSDADLCALLRVEPEEFSELYDAARPQLRVVTREGDEDF